MNMKARFFSLIFLILLGIGLFHFLGIKAKNFKGSDAGLGIDTMSINDEWRGLLLNSGTPDPRLLQTVEKFFNDQKNYALWLGASQLHSINLYQANEHLAVWYTNENASRRSSNQRYVLMSQPNGNFHDLLGMYLCLKAKTKRLPKKVLIALVYDDLVEEGLKPPVGECLPEYNEKLNKTSGSGYAQLYKLKTLAQTDVSEKENSSQQKSEKSKVFNEKLEDFFSKLLEEKWEAYRYRDNLYSKLVFDFYSFGYYYIRKLSKRRGPVVSPEMKAWNLQALQALVKILKADKVEIYMYRQPHRPGEVPFYHDRGEYDKFYQEMVDYSKEAGFHIADFETIVPADHWGLTGWRMPDVFHFKNIGHEILGKHIDQWMRQKEVE